jgi:hypothetical protein
MALEIVSGAGIGKGQEGRGDGCKAYCSLFNCRYLPVAGIMIKPHTV